MPSIPEMSSQSLGRFITHNLPDVAGLSTKDPKELTKVIGLLTATGLLTGGLWYISEDFSDDVVEGLIVSSLPIAAIGIRYLQYPQLNMRLYNFAYVIFLPLGSVVIDIVSKWIVRFFSTSKEDEFVDATTVGSSSFDFPGAFSAKTLTIGAVQGLMYSVLSYYTRTYKIFFDEPLQASLWTTLLWMGWYTVYTSMK